MTKYFITGDAFSFYAPDNYMLCTFEDNKIIGLKDSKASTTSNTINSMSDSAEVYGCEFVTLKSEAEAFIYNLSTVEEDNFKLILTFGVNATPEYIVKIVAEATAFHIDKNHILIETEILDKELFYTDIEKLNEELSEHALIYSISNGLTDINPTAVTIIADTEEDDDYPF